MQNDSVIPANCIDAFFAIGLALISAFHCKRIAKSPDRLDEGDTMKSPVSVGLGVIPFIEIIHEYTDYPYLSQLAHDYDELNA